MTVEVRKASPTDPAIAFLIDRHLTLMRASSPACSIHAMEAEDLAGAGAAFFAVFDGEDVVGMGALKRISAGHGELKSMHVVEERRGEGLADAILARLLEEANIEGLSRVSLETGSQDAFRAARAFYARHGFEFCAPFEGYVEDPNSVFMTRAV